MPASDKTLKELTDMINAVMGHRVLTEEQMQRIMRGAKKAYDQGGMVAVLEYLMKVTQANVDLNELKQFADTVRANPNLGMDILQGKKKFPR